jgi:hypothetical protein
MSACADSARLSPEACVREVAANLAAGVLRPHGRAALATACLEGPCHNASPFRPASA